MHDGVQVIRFQGGTEKWKYSVVVKWLAVAEEAEKSWGGSSLSQ